MTTQELKQQIDKVLGNSIRCLLPSYWWKRLFSLTLDKVDEKLDAANIKTINGESVIGEGNLKVGITSVSSMEELNILEVEAGDVATVVSREYGKINPYACYRLTSEPTNKNVIIENWDKFKRITHIDALMAEESVSGFPTVVLHAYALYGQDACQLTYTGRSYVIKVGNSSNSVSYTLEELNNLLKESDYRLMGVSDGDVSQEFINKYVSLYTPDVIVSDAYVKGDTWTRLLKEGDAVGGGVYRELYATGDGFANVEGELTEEQKEYNRETLELLNGNIQIIYKVSNLTLNCLNYQTHDIAVVFYFEYLDIYQIAIQVNNDGSAECLVSTNVLIDDKLSDTSTKTVQNKVVTAALNNKVDKVNGKQLSTEDFTSALKTKLEGLSNYDDTSIQNAVNSLTTQIATKQDKLVSRTNIKTINGESILGEGNIVVNVDTSGLASQLASKQDTISDLSTIRNNASLGATAIQKVKTINSVSLSGEGNIELHMSEIHKKLQDIKTVVLNNEEVLAAALNEINRRLLELENLSN
jgi:hypothetical protein